MKQDKFVELQSQVGNTIVVPSQWTSEDQGAVWFLSSPDGQAAISIFTFTMEGSGNVEDITQLMIARRLPNERGGWHEKGRTMVPLKQGDALVVELEPDFSESKSRNRLYVLQAGRMYHCLVVNAGDVPMDLNGAFYESVVRSFVGIE